MKNILLKFNDERLEFLNSITRDFEGKQLTDRVNYALNQIPILFDDLIKMTNISLDWEQQARRQEFECEQITRDLSQIKHALDVIKVFSDSSNKGAGISSK